jgi:hypothetical protein
MTPIVISDEWLEKLCRAQGISYERVSSVIIEARAGEPVVMYVTQFGDAKIWDVGPPEVVPPKVTAS